MSSALALTHVEIADPSVIAADNLEHPLDESDAFLGRENGCVYEKPSDSFPRYFLGAQIVGCEIS